MKNFFVAVGTIILLPMLTVSLLTVLIILNDFLGIHKHFNNDIKIGAYQLEIMKIDE